jgi:hypothetical protein
MGGLLPTYGFIVDSEIVSTSNQMPKLLPNI